MIETRFTLPSGEWNRLRDAFGRNTRLFHDVRAKALAECGRVMVSDEIPRVFARSGPGWPSLRYREGKPLVDTGKLMRSVKWGLANGEKTLYIYSQQHYADTHQFGAGALGGPDALRIEAKGKYLSVPGGPYVHVPFARELSDQQRRHFRPFTDFPGARLLRGKRGWIIAVPEKIGKRRWIAIAALRKAVMAPARPLVVLTEAIMDRFGDIWSGAVRAAMK